MMAKIYFNRLIVGTITFDAIPEKYYSAVISYGIEWVQSGRMTSEQFEQMFKEEYPLEV